ncbi:chitinase-3-like protein 1 [Folsomia candida]|uniref:chitinase-3-like protein 1 n=1 Tax=Folsomia candida TaxID=158441 RepID=UPI000B8F4940|nr:chitinase-3-like protein 1 [Folsomia candida]
MEGFKLLVLAAALIGVTCGVSISNQEPKKLVCYYGSWAVYRPGDGKFDVEHMDPMLCTHLIYGFAGLAQDGTLRILDDYNDLEENWGRGAMRRFTNFKLVNPNLKVLLAIGGWNEGSIRYSDMALTQASRRRFIDSVTPFLDRYNFDGFDLDWEYPADRGGRPEDKANFALLCEEMRADFDTRGWLLTAAVSAGIPTIDKAYDVPSISRSLHFINVMTYDFHGGWESYTHHNSPMDAIPEVDTGNNTWLNAKSAIDHWITRGCPPEKLILGMGTYGRGWTLNDASENGFYAPANQPIEAGPYTREPGIWGFNEVLEKFAQEPGQWTIVRNEFVAAPYAFNQRKWISYDDVESINGRVSYVLDKGLGGGMFWSIETDDFHGLYSSEAFPLLKTARRGLIGGDIPTPPPTTTDPTAPTTVTTPRPSPPPDGLCTAPGLVPNPTNCRIYHMCVPIGGGEYDVVTYHCPEGTVYFPDMQICNWFDGPGCP